MSTHRPHDSDLMVVRNDFPVDTPFFTLDSLPALVALDEAVEEPQEVMLISQPAYMILRRMEEHRYERILFPFCEMRPRKHWVMDQDWKQRLPRRRRKHK